MFPLLRLGWRGISTPSCGWPPPANVSVIGGPARCRAGGDRPAVRHDPPTPIGWRCSVCADEGVISNWEDSPYDLRRRRFTVIGAFNEVVITDEVAAALRELMFLDPDCERLVFGMRAHHCGGAVLHASEDDLDELIGFVAAEANHESNRRRQRRLDAAFDFLATAAHNMQRPGDVMALPNETPDDRRTKGETVPRERR